jgi:hypothetical protein
LVSLLLGILFQAFFTLPAPALYAARARETFHLNVFK